ncbi:MAG: thioesterase [Desulfatitalea sp. BRH_c12]|nr:MAG: thioesterase [Desulfatitalea sp. BRH_c12]
MDIITHQTIDTALCGRPLQVENGHSRVELLTTSVMAADQSGLVHGGFIFSLADYAAMLAVNHPNVVLGSAEVKFVKPVRVNVTVTAEARIESIQGKKTVVNVTVNDGVDAVFQGIFTCFIPSRHVLDNS